MPESNSPKKKEDKTDLDVELTVLQHIEAQVNRADQKAQFTLTVGTILLASTSLLNADAVGGIFDPDAQVTNRVATIFFIAMLTAIIVSTFFSLLVVVPRLIPPQKVPKNLFYFGSILKTNEQHFIEDYKDQKKDLKPMILSEIYALSIIAKRKFVHVRLSYIFLAAAIVLWVVGQILTFLF